MKCSRCGRDICEAESYEYSGETLCEDCYLYAMSPVKGCDPVAVRFATRFREKSGLKGAEGLTESQRSIYELVRSKGKVTREEVMETLAIPERDLERQLATLRHCELVKGQKEGDKVYLVPFNHYTS